MKDFFHICPAVLSPLFKNTFIQFCRTGIRSQDRLYNVTELYADHRFYTFVYQANIPRHVNLHRHRQFRL